MRWQYIDRYISLGVRGCVGACMGYRDSPRHVYMMQGMGMFMNRYRYGDGMVITDQENNIFNIAMLMFICIYYMCICVYMYAASEHQQSSQSAV
jgi:hypothetical protein